MKSLTNLATAFGALALIATPIVAQAADAPALRTASAVDDAEGVSGGGVIIGLLALAAIVGAVVIALEDEDTPTSP